MEDLYKEVLKSLAQEHPPWSKGSLVKIAGILAAQLGSEFLGSLLGRCVPCLLVGNRAGAFSLLDTSTPAGRARTLRELVLETSALGVVTVSEGWDRLVRQEVVDDLGEDQKLLLDPVVISEGSVFWTLRKDLSAEDYAVVFALETRVSVTGHNCRGESFLYALCLDTRTRAKKSEMWVTTWEGGQLRGGLFPSLPPEEVSDFFFHSPEAESLREDYLSGHLPFQQPPVAQEISE